MTELAYDFEWDTHKAESNLRKHGVTFKQASTVFLDGQALTLFDAAHSDFEERWFTLGYAQGDVLLAIAHTYTVTSPSSARVRIISARPVTKQERRYYADQPR